MSFMDREWLHPFTRLINRTHSRRDRDCDYQTLQALRSWLSTRPYTFTRKRLQMVDATNLHLQSLPRYEQNPRRGCDEAEGRGVEAAKRHINTLQLSNPFTRQLNTTRGNTSKSLSHTDTLQTLHRWARDWKEHCLSRRRVDDRREVTKPGHFRRYGVFKEGWVPRRLISGSLLSYPGPPPTLSGDQENGLLSTKVGLPLLRWFVSSEGRTTWILPLREEALLEKEEDGIGFLAHIDAQDAEQIQRMSLAQHGGPDDLRILQKAALTLGNRTSVYVTGVALEFDLIHACPVDFFALCLPIAGAGGAQLIPLDEKRSEFPLAASPKVLRDRTDELVDLISRAAFSDNARDGTLFNAPLHSGTSLKGQLTLNGKSKAAHTGRASVSLSRKGDNSAGSIASHVRDSIRVWWDISKVVRVFQDQLKPLDGHYSILCGVRPQVEPSKVLKTEDDGLPEDIGCLQSVRVTVHVRHCIRKQMTHYLSPQGISNVLVYKNSPKRLQDNLLQALPTLNLQSLPRYEHNPPEGGCRQAVGLAVKSGAHHLRLRVPFTRTPGDRRSKCLEGTRRTGNRIQHEQGNKGFSDDLPDRVVFCYSPIAQVPEMHPLPPDHYQQLKRAFEDRICGDNFCGVSILTPHATLRGHPSLILHFLGLFHSQNLQLLLIVPIYLHILLHGLRHPSFSPNFRLSLLPLL
ncbi:hypothetical protein HRG_014222 [Hirsutella rhossiliensis]